MNGKRSSPFPVWMIAFDVIGTLLLGLGLFGIYGGFAHESVSAAHLKSVSIASIIFGVLLMLPLLVTLIRQALSRTRAK